jgi:hypothetical protein
MPLTVGALPGASVQGWHGAVDDIRLYNRALPMSTIVALRDSGLRGDPGLLQRTRLPFIVQEAPAAPEPPSATRPRIPWETLPFLIP